MVMEEVSGYQTGSLGIHLWIDNTYIGLWNKAEISAEDAKLSYVNTATRFGVLCISLLHLSSIKTSDKLFLPCRDISLFYAYFLLHCLGFLHIFCMCVMWWMYVVGVMLRKISVFPLALMHV